MKLNVYHASDDDSLHRKGFDTKKVKTKNFKGFYFGASPKQVRRFGKNIYKVSVDVDNLYEIENKDYNKKVLSGVNTKHLKEKGFDSMVVWDVDYGSDVFPYELVVFDKRRIKKINKL